MAQYNIVRIIEHIKTWCENHKGVIDSTIGGGIGFTTGISHYWEHFQEEEFFKLIDGALGTAVNTLIGIFLFWFVHTYILKTKKKK